MWWWWWRKPWEERREEKANLLGSVFELLRDLVKKKRVVSGEKIATWHVFVFFI